MSFESVQEKTGWAACIELWPLQWIFYTHGFEMGSFFAMCYVEQKGEIKECLLGHWPEKTHLWTYCWTSKFICRHWDLNDLIFRSTEQPQAPQNWWFAKRKGIGSINLDPSPCKEKAVCAPLELHLYRLLEESCNLLMFDMRFNPSK